MAYSKPGYIFQQKCCADWCLKSCLGPIVSKNNLCQIQKLPYVLYRYRYRIRLEGKSSIGIDIEFEKKEQLANIRFRTQTNVYRTTLPLRTQKFCTQDEYCSIHFPKVAQQEYDK